MRYYRYVAGGWAMRVRWLRKALANLDCAAGYKDNNMKGYIQLEIIVPLVTYSTSYYAYAWIADVSIPSGYQAPQPQFWSLLVAATLGLLVSRLQERSPFCHGAVATQRWAALFRAFGWLSGLAAGYQGYHGLQQTLAVRLYGGSLESLAEPVAWCGALMLVLSLGVLLHALPDWLNSARLAGRVTAAPAREILGLGAAWLLVILLLTGYQTIADVPAFLSHHLAFSPESLSHLLLAALAATTVYSGLRIGLMRMDVSILGLHWFKGSWPRLKITRDTMVKPTVWLVFDRPLCRKTDGAFIDQLARAWNDAPLVLVAQPGGDMLGEHGYLVDQQGRLKALFPRLEIELSDWQRLLPPPECWRSLELREIYPSEALLPAAVRTLRGEQDRVILVNGDGLERWRGVLPEETTRVLVQDTAADGVIENIAGYQTMVVRKGYIPELAFSGKINNVSDTNEHPIWSMELYLKVVWLYLHRPVSTTTLLILTVIGCVLVVLSPACGELGNNYFECLNALEQHSTKIIDLIGIYEGKTMDPSIIFIIIFLANAYFNITWGRKWMRHIPPPKTSITLMRKMLWPVLVSDSIVLMIGLGIIYYLMLYDKVNNHNIPYFVIIGSLLVLNSTIKQGSFLLSHRKDVPTNGGHCFICAKQGHYREMVLVSTPSLVNLRLWDKPWSPTQGCFECANCGRLACYTHSDRNMPCDCGACSWIEKTYLQKELDNMSLMDVISDEGLHKTDSPIMESASQPHEISTVHNPQPASNHIFISYRTKDAPCVRLITEQLLAEGVPLWFDEYKITTKQRAHIVTGGLPVFDKVIHDAIKSSSAAICFTNVGYSESEYCRNEASFITNQAPKIKIIDIRCPEHKELYKKPPELSHAESIIQSNELNRLDLDGVENLWGQIAATLNMPNRLLTLERPTENLVTMEWLDPVRYTMDFGGWQQTDGRKVENNVAFDVRGGMFMRRAHGLTINATVRVGLQAGVYRSKFDVDDRLAFILATGKMMDQFTNKYLAAIGMKTDVVGTHFITVKNLEADNLGHAFFTLYNPVFKTWSRQYSVVLPNPLKNQIEVNASLKKRQQELGSEIEFCVKFDVTGATFQQYCRVGYLMDRVVASLRCF
ncbi:MAG: TIR domain-containing protein [Methylococcaceae bacterium]|nr:MAG: TIR domain-containing protein [Methylococcaceae bacterium]